MTPWAASRARLLHIVCCTNVVPVFGSPMGREIGDRTAARAPSLLSARPLPDLTINVNQTPDPFAGASALYGHETAMDKQGNGNRTGSAPLHVAEHAVTPATCRDAR